MHGKILVPVCVLLLLLGGLAVAQVGGLGLAWWAPCSGGATSTGAGYTFI